VWASEEAEVVPC